jgi:hypothetical protein
MIDQAEQTASTRSKWLRRGPWENAAMALIALGVIMLMQPISILAGTLGFVVVSHFPE